VKGHDLHTRCGARGFASEFGDNGCIRRRGHAGGHGYADGSGEQDGPTSDPVSHPDHYRWHPAGVECIAVAEEFGYNLGNVIKYVWRADRKGDAIEDLRKARQYLDFEIERRARRSARAPGGVA
jgi:hypothetical protein